VVGSGATAPTLTGKFLFGKRNRAERRAPSLLTGGRNVVAIMIETDGEHIHSIFAVINPDKLAPIAPATPR
jgi:hypothetical protein